MSEACDVIPFPEREEMELKRPPKSYYWSQFHAELVKRPMPHEKRHLKVYSAGAVAPPLRDAIAIFEKTSKVECDLRIGKPEDLLKEIAKFKKGDVFSSGAEYILDGAEDQGLIASTNTSE